MISLPECDKFNACLRLHFTERCARLFGGALCSFSFVLKPYWEERNEGALSIWWKILVEFLGFYLYFQKKRTILWGIPEFFEILTRNFRSILFFPLEFPEWLAKCFDSVTNSKISALLLISQELSVHSSLFEVFGIFWFNRNASWSRALDFLSVYDQDHSLLPCSLHYSLW